MLPEVLLVLYLLSHSLHHGFAGTVNECTDEVSHESIVSATCHWDGQLTVTWGANEGIVIFYNCTGQTDQQGDVYGWGFAGPSSTIINIEGWSYYNSTCYIYGCYADIYYSTYVIPSTTCQVLMPPIQPTSSFIPSFLTRTVDDSFIEYDDFPSVEPYSPSVGSGFSPYPSLYTEESSTSSRPSPRQTSLLISATGVAVFVVICFSVIFVVLFVVTTVRQLNQHRNYSLHKIPFPVKDEENMQGKIDIQDRIRRTDSVESKFDKFVENNADVSKVSTMVAERSVCIADPDAVSEKTFRGEEAETEEAEIEEIDDNVESIQEQEMKENHLDDDSIHVGTSSTFNCVLPRFCLTRSKGYTSASTSGQTSEYMYTSYSSDANTVSTSNMENVLFPDDSAPFCDEVFVCDEMCEEDFQKQNSLSTNSPVLDRHILLSGTEAPSNPIYDFNAGVSEHQVDAFCLHKNIVPNNSSGVCLRNDSADGDISSGFDQDLVNNGARDPAIPERSGSDDNESYTKREVEQGKEEDQDVQDDSCSI